MHVCRHMALALEVAFHCFRNKVGEARGEEVSKVQARQPGNIGVLAKKEENGFSKKPNECNWDGEEDHDDKSPLKMSSNFGFILCAGE